MSWLTYIARKKHLQIVGILFLPVFVAKSGIHRGKCTANVGVFRETNFRENISKIISKKDENDRSANFELILIEN